MPAVLDMSVILHVAVGRHVCYDGLLPITHERIGGVGELRRVVDVNGGVGAAIRGTEEADGGE